MLTDRDKDVLRHIEKYKVITIKQADVLFFRNYKSAARRLLDLERAGVLKSYYSKVKNEKIYYIDKKVNEHRLYILDFLKFLKENNCEIVKVEIEPSYLKGNLRPDMFVEFNRDGYKYLILLEVDYTHYTDNSKMNTLYEQLYKEKEEYKEFLGTFPMVVISRPTKGIRYNSSNFEVFYTSLDYSELSILLF